MYATKLDFVTTNNEAEYEAILARLSIAREMGATNVEIRSDSQVVVGQIRGDFTAQGERMIKYLDKVREFQSCFERVVLTKIPREKNIRVDALSRVGSETDQEIKTARQKVIIKAEPSIALKQDMMQVDEATSEPEWATDVI